MQGTGLLASVHSYNSWCGFGLAFRSQRTSNEGSSFSNSAHLDANCLGSIRFVPLWISNGHSFTYCLLRVITPWTSQPRRSPWNRCAAKDVAKKPVDDDQGWWGWGYQVIPESYIVMLDSMPYSLIIVLYVFIFSILIYSFIFHRYFRKLDLLNRAKQGSAFDISVKMTRLRMMYSPWRHNCEVTKVRLQTDCYPGRKASLIQFACLRSLTAFLAALHAEMQTSCGHHKGTAASASASYTRTLSTTVYMRMNI